MTRNTVYIRSGSNTIYLSGITHPAYVSGSPWSSEGTTPYALSGNDTTGGVWTPAAPPLGADMWAPPIEETVGVQCYASDQDGLIYLKRLLHTALNYQAGQRPYLAVQSGTNTVYYDLYGARVQEDARYAVESGLMRLSVTWRRSAWGGRLTTPQTLISAVSIVNAGTGSPDNVEAFGSTASGDLINEGSPMNYSITSTSASGGDPARKVILASIYSRTYYALSSSNTWSTSSTSYSGAGITLGAIDLSPLISIPQLRMRVTLDIASSPAVTGTPEIRIMVRNNSVSYGVVGYSAPIPRTDGDGFTVFDPESGPIPISVGALRNLTDTSYDVAIQVRSADGASTTGTVSSGEIVLYYDWCEVSMENVNFDGGNEVLEVCSFAERSGYPCLPLDIPQGFHRQSGGTVREFLRVRGTVPRYFTGASLYVRAKNRTGSTSGNEYVSTARPLTITATHAPLYATLRGGA